MIDIGNRLRQIRGAKGLSQGHIEKRTGFFRCYISRIECGYTIPTLETLGKWAKALNVPLYRVFLPEPANPQRGRLAHLTSKDKRLYRLLCRMDETGRRLFLSVANTVVKQGGKHGRKR